MTKPNIHSCFCFKENLSIPLSVGFKKMDEGKHVYVICSLEVSPEIKKILQDRENVTVIVDIDRPYAYKHVILMLGI